MVWLELGEPPHVAVNVAACIAVVSIVTAEVFTIAASPGVRLDPVALKAQFGWTVPIDPTERAATTQRTCHAPFVTAVMGVIAADARIVVDPSLKVMVSVCVVIVPLE